MKQSSRLPGILIAGMLVSNCSAYTARVEAKNPTQVTVAKSHSQSASMATAQPQVEVPSQAAPTFRLFGLPFHLWGPCWPARSRRRRRTRARHEWQLTPPCPVATKSRRPSDRGAPGRGVDPPRLASSRRKPVMSKAAAKSPQSPPFSN
jgi:hypothetical protein